MTVADYQNPRAADGESLVANGFVGCIRYTYNLTASELEDLWGRGLAVGVVFEHLTSDIDGGYAQGLVNGRRARGIVSSLGFPAVVPVYWAVDRRTYGHNDAALDYGRGFTDGCGVSRPYGESSLIDDAVAAGLCDKGWCPETWDTTDSPHLALIQRVNIASPIPNTDLNTEVVTDWGGYKPPPVPPPVPPTPILENSMDEQAIYQTVKGMYGDVHNTDVAGMLKNVSMILARPRAEWAVGVSTLAAELAGP